MTGRKRAEKSNTMATMIYFGNYYRLWAIPAFWEIHSVIPMISTTQKIKHYKLYMRRNIQIIRGLLERKRSQIGIQLIKLE